jgi:hypothetical protein
MKARRSIEKEVKFLMTAAPPSPGFVFLRIKCAFFELSAED